MTNKMTKKIQKNLVFLGGLLFVAQTSMISAIPAVSAAGLLTDNQSMYMNAATSADPIVYDKHMQSTAKPLIVKDNSSDGLTLSGIIEHLTGSVSVKTEPEANPTTEEIKKYVLNEAKKAGLNVREVEAIVTCESRWDDKAINDKNTNGSTDMGLWQINSIHKNLSTADKLNYKTATAWAIKKRLADGNWMAWYCAHPKKLARFTAEIAE